MKKKIVAALLAGTALAMVAVTGCGSSAPTTETETSTETAADTEEDAEPEANTEASGDEVKPLYPLETADDALADGGYSVSFTADDLLEMDAGYELTVEVFQYDSYDPSDIDNLAAGSKIQVCQEDVTVEDIEKDSETGYVTINGGVENGGVELMEEDGLYRTNNMDNLPMYYSVGEVTIPFSSDITFEDQVDSPEESDLPVVEASEVPDAIKNSETPFNGNNTVITVRQEQIVQIIRYWIP